MLLQSLWLFFVIKAAERAGDARLEPSPEGRKTLQPAGRAGEPSGQKQGPGRNWKYKKKSFKAKTPRWYDISCELLNKQIRLSSRLLKMFPANAFLRGKLSTECK